MRQHCQIAKQSNKSRFVPEFKSSTGLQNENSKLSDSGDKNTNQHINININNHSFGLPNDQKGSNHADKKMNHHINININNHRPQVETNKPVDGNNALHPNHPQNNENGTEMKDEKLQFDLIRKESSNEDIRHGDKNTKQQADSKKVIAENNLTNQRSFGHPTESKGLQDYADTIVNKTSHIGYKK